MITFISAPRCGSTWVYEYVKRYNVKHYNALTFPKDEFLNRDFNVWLEMNSMYREDWKDLDSKLSFLESNPLYTYKTHVNHVRDARDRFDNLIKDNHRIILKRKDTWRAYLSFYVRKYLKQNGLSTEIVHHRKKVDFPDIEIRLESVIDGFFIDNLKLLDTYDGEVLYYEDLSDDKLEHTFGIKAKSVVKNDIEYEDYIIDLDRVRTLYLNQSHQ